MIKLILPRHPADKIRAALKEAGRREIGGVLMAEHVGTNEFRIVDLTIHERGTFAYFIRKLEQVIAQLRTFFERVDHNYVRFNYAGEWHSHPSFEPEPSSEDDRSIQEIVNDAKVGANFVVLLIVKLDSEGQLVGTAYTYLPDGTKHKSDLSMID